MAAVLRYVALREGIGTRGWEHAKRLIAVAGDEPLSSKDAHRLLMTVRYAEADLLSLPEELKWVLLRGSMEIAVADHRLTDDEEAAVIDVICDMWGPSEDTVRRIFRSLTQILSAEHDPKRTAAFEALGLAETATTADIRAAYIASAQQHHSGLASSDTTTEATAHITELDAAYDYLIGISGA